MEMDENTYSFDSINCFASSTKSFSREDCFLKGCKWDPNQSCIATCTSDNRMQFFLVPANVARFGHSLSLKETPTYSELEMGAYIKPGGVVYDYEWWPGTCHSSRLCLMTAGSSGPIHIWNVRSGEIVASYQMYDDKDEVIHGVSVGCSSNGEKVYGGTISALYIFNAERSGRDSRIIKERRLKKAIVSAIAVNPIRDSLFAFGTYNKLLGICDEEKLLCTFSGHKKGLTQVKFSPDGLKLYCGMRGNGEIVCYDLRNPGMLLCRMSRQVQTQQRIYFDLTDDGRYLISGGTDGNVLIWDNSRMATNNVSSPIKKFSANTDCTNGVSINRSLPIIATASGQYHKCVHMSSSSSEEEDLDSYDCCKNKKDYSLKLWWFN